jgi:hypothetical protein
MKKYCRIQKYDPKVTEPPYEFITLEEKVEVSEPVSLDDGGKTFAGRLTRMCDNLGYKFRFYSLSPKQEDVDYDVIVRGELEDILGI